MDEQLTTRTYVRVWKQEHVIYRIERVPLPFPVSFRQIGVFFASLAVLTPIYFIPWQGAWWVWLGLLPGLTTWLVLAQGLRFDDGSMPEWGRLLLTAAGAAAVWLAIKLLLAFGHQRPVGWFVLLPLLLTWYLTRKSLDGRNPLKFVWVFVRYLCTPKRLARYRKQVDHGCHFLVARARVARHKPPRRWLSRIRKAVPPRAIPRRVL